MFSSPMLAACHSAMRWGKGQGWWLGPRHQPQQGQHPGVPTEKNGALWFWVAASQSSEESADSSQQRPRAAPHQVPLWSQKDAQVGQNQPGECATYAAGR